MAREIDHKLIPIGIKSEKRGLSPHLTLGRVKRPSDFSELTTYMENLNFDAGRVILRRVALVKSTLTPSGPIYENVKLFELE
jgi:2'-5' RNA ligase